MTRPTLLAVTISAFILPSCATQVKTDDGVVHMTVRLAADFNVSLVRGLKLVIDSAPGAPSLGLTPTDEWTVRKGSHSFTAQVKNDDADPEPEFVVQFNTNVFGGSRAFLFRYNGSWGADRPFAVRAVVLLEGANQASATVTATVDGNPITLVKHENSSVGAEIHCTPGVSCIGTTAAPTLVGTNPPSPANNNLPRIRGQALAGSAIKIFATLDCSGTVAGEGTGAELATDGIAVSVADNSTTTFSAIAIDAVGNKSPCASATVAYIEDSTPPAAPTVNAATNPPSPGKSLTPRLTGSAEIGATVQLFKNDNCEGAPAASGSAVLFASTGIAVSVANNTTTTISVRAVDVAGNRSPCATPPPLLHGGQRIDHPGLHGDLPCIPCEQQLSTCSRERGVWRNGAPL